MTRGPASSRKTAIIDGIEHAECASCHRMLPVDLEHYYLQRARIDGSRRGAMRPHSWCKPCYRTNSGRGPGMRDPKPAPVPPEVVQALRDAAEAAGVFLRLPATSAGANLVPTP